MDCLVTASNQKKIIGCPWYFGDQLSSSDSAGEAKDWENKNIPLLGLHSEADGLWGPKLVQRWGIALK